MQQFLAYISAHWMEGAIWLLGIGWGYLVKKVTEYKTIKDGLLAIMHDAQPPARGVRQRRLPFHIHVPVRGGHPQGRLP